MNARNGHRASALATATLALVTGAFTTSVRAQEARLGEIDFPNSGAPAAQQPFVRGVLLLHSFEYEAAAEAFRTAQRADGSFALAYWGEAMTYNHPLWREQDREAALQALGRYAPTPDARLARAPTERERGYLAAVDVLYGDGTKGERDRAYMEAMGRIAETYPEDLNARAFWSLSILGSTDGERDFATYMRAAATAQPVFDANPLHPGAAHYIIHSFDDPVHAPLGLNAARAYTDIAPGAAHAQHMTSHIFVAMGMWDDVVTANIRARDVQNAQLLERGRPPNVCGHYTSWLHYGLLQQGRFQEAEQGMQECFDRIASGGTDPERSYFVSMLARHTLDTRSWDAPDRWSTDVFSPAAAHLGHTFVRGYAALQRNERTAGAELLAEHARRREQMGTDLPRARIEELELQALLAAHDGNGDSAIELLREATALEESLPFEFGPPASLKPPHELLGEVLLDARRYADAAEAFRRSLAFTPERTASLEGLMRAARMTGDVATADDARGRLEEIWRHADPGVTTVWRQPG